MALIVSLLAMAVAVLALWVLVLRSEKRALMRDVLAQSAQIDQLIAQNLDLMRELRQQRHRPAVPHWRDTSASVMVRPHADSAE